MPIKDTITLVTEATPRPLFLWVFDVTNCDTWIMHGVRPRAAFDAVRLISYFALFY